MSSTTPRSRSTGRTPISSIGAISGSGAVQQNGTGTTTLTAVNTYAGATTISAGTLALSGAGSIANSSGVIDNGTFDISATTRGSLDQEPVRRGHRDARQPDADADQCCRHVRRRDRRHWRPRQTGRRPLRSCRAPTLISAPPRSPAATCGSTDRSQAQSTCKPAQRCRASARSAVWLRFNPAARCRRAKARER